MVNLDKFKLQVIKIVSQDYEIEFLGKNFDKIISSLTEIKINKIYQWLTKVKCKLIQPIVIGTKKPYKNWTMNELLVFRYPFSVDNIDYRIMLVKVKNVVYIEFHLGNHKYYDKIRKDLGLKKNNY